MAHENISLCGLNPDPRRICREGFTRFAQPRIIRSWGRALARAHPGHFRSRFRREAAQTGQKNNSHKARDGRAPQAYSTVRRGARPSATQQTCPDPSPRQKTGEKCGPVTICMDYQIMGGEAARPYGRHPPRIGLCCRNNRRTGFQQVDFN
jgi:hypothetical protein